MRVRLPRQLEDPWVQATSLDTPAASVTVLGPTGASSLDVGLGATGRWYVCAGAEGMAPDCAVVETPAASEVALAPGPGTRVLGRCVNDDGTPARAHLSLGVADLATTQPLLLPLARNANGLVFDVASARDGAFSIPPLAAGDYVFEVTGPGGRLEHPPRFTVPPIEKPKQPQAPGTPARAITVPDIVLTRGLELIVTVTDTSGVPLAAAEVGAVEGGAPDGVVFFHARTDSDGRAVLSGFDGGKKVRVSATSPDSERAEQELAALPAIVSFALERLAAIAGRVVSQDGDPVPGAHVRLAHSESAMITDGKGVFRFEHVKPGPQRVAAWRSDGGKVQVDATVDPGDELDLGDLVLEPTETIRGLVRDAETHEPVTGAAVSPAGWPPFPAVTTDGDGLFSLEASGTEALQAEVSKEGYAPLLTRLLPTGGDDARDTALIEIGHAGWIEVRAWDDASGGPCVGCRVAIDGAAIPETLPLVTNASGEARSSELAPGDYTVYLETVRATGSVVAVSGGDNVRVATVRPRAVVLVQFGSGRIELRLRLEPDPGMAWRLRCSGDGSDALLLNQGGGLYVLRATPGERYRLALHDGAYTEVGVGLIEVPAKAAEVAVALFPTAVTGIVARAGGPPAGVGITLTSLDGTIAGATITDGLGRFTVPFIQPGAYLVSAGGEPLRTVSVGGNGTVDLGTVQVSGEPHG